MRRFSFESVSGCERIFHNGDFVILSGKNPWLFRKDGTYIAKYKHIHNAYNMVFLPGNTVLMDSSGDRGYHYISLDDGHVIWSLPQKGRRGATPNQFAVSPDGKIVYYVYEIKGILHIDHFHLQKGTYKTYVVPLERRETSCCFCDDDGILKLLQSFLVKNYSEDGSYSTRSEHGLLQWSPQDQTPSWKYHWIGQLGSSSGYPQICNDVYVLLDDFTVISFNSHESFNLLENDPLLGHPFLKGFKVLAFDSERLLLSVIFFRSFSTVIIDCKARKVLSHYAPLARGLSGCLIEEKFWAGAVDGIVKRPFPYMDEYPSRF